MPSSIPRKKKLFLTDGTTVPLTGICVYMLRLSNSKPLPEEGFHKVSQIFAKLNFYINYIIFPRIFTNLRKLVSALLSLVVYTSISAM